MRMLRMLGKIALVILLLTLIVSGVMYFVKMARGAESDLPDPTRNKSPEQETVEKYFNAFLKRDFDIMVSYTRGVDKLETRARRIANYKKFFKEGEEALVKMYKKEYNGEYLSRAYEPQTLITYQRGENRNGDTVVLVFYTEVHKVKVPGSDKPWQFFWPFGYFITLKENKIIDIKPLTPPEELLMILKSENCVRPAICD